MPQPGQVRVAVVGAGVAGLAAADALAGIDVTLYDAAPRAGGHVYTVEADGHAIDMGFIVHNRARYPHFTALLAELAIPTRATAMSFSVSGIGRAWASTSFSTWFADRRGLADPRHWRFLAGLVAFLGRARADLRAAALDARAVAARTSLAEYLEARRVPRAVREQFALPLASALWSLAPERCGEFPARSYLAFLDQHGMLSPGKPLEWRTIAGGSRRYVDAWLARLHARGRFALELGTPVAQIRRDDRGVHVATARGERRYDRVVIATHADTALALLADASPAERAALGAFRYSRNRAVLHTDRAFLPREPAAHAAWNYCADADTGRACVTYSMTKLQGLPDAPYLVTLNPRREPRGVLHETWFDHPQFDRAALAAQRAIAELAGARRTYFAGAHLGVGFHEDGMRTGRAAAAMLRGDLRADLRAQQREHDAREVAFDGVSLRAL